MLRDNRISPEDLDRFQILDDPDEAVKHIQKYVIV
jgi:predicted Rossmann-fold nucleotide-binding protein